ncbi:metal ABC transporter ATP-binding protein [Thiocystis minor]|uniref:metal ABC transporter ATP-binding protein n=1 Tax=Thiocystis minor TaxID=61597 RepID=UPI001A921CF2|nr:metal ABC transporter ATP-binding protein [Thiocystis minor]
MFAHTLPPSPFDHREKASAIPPAAERPEAPVILVRDLSFSYGDALVLEQVNLSIAPGEFVGLVGPNAGGKSTLLKLILGLLAPQTGQIRVLGQPPRQAARRIGYVPQFPSFPRDFPISVEQAVAMGRLGIGPMLGWHRAADRDAARRALEEVEALDLARRRIGTLSGGQLQRVLLARALAGEAEILILDEPTANIDQRVESDIFDLLAVLNRRLTILLVSHDIAFISDYVSRVACLNRTLLYHGTDAVNAETIQQLYGGHVRLVAHRH